MKLFQKAWNGVRRAGQLVYQGNDMSLNTGVWVTRISREAVVAQIVFSILVFGVNVLLWWSGGRGPKQWANLSMLTCAVVVGLLSTALAHALDKDPDRPPSLSTFLKWAGLTTLFGLPLGHLIFYVAAKVAPMPATWTMLGYFPEIMVAAVIGFSYWRLVIIQLWYERLATEALKRHTAEQGQALAETRLLMLQAQIEPHFLFNTLASVQHLVRKDPEQADFLLAQLISYLRQAIPDVRGAASDLGREFASVQTYLDIVRVRMGGRLTVRVACEAALEAVPFPALVIHTLVENAIKHGVEMKTGPVSISVLARDTLRHGMRVIDVSVEDDGVGLGETFGMGNGVGLRNIRDRLTLAYHGRARLDIADAPGGGVCATVTIPKESV